MNREELEDAIERIQSHFRCLFNHMVRSMPLGILEEELNVVDTKFGKITLTDDGQVLIDPEVWERMSAELKKLDGIRGKIHEHCFTHSMCWLSEGLEGINVRKERGGG